MRFSICIEFRYFLSVSALLWFSSWVISFSWCCQIRSLGSITVALPNLWKLSISLYFDGAIIKCSLGSWFHVIVNKNTGWNYNLGIWWLIKYKIIWKSSFLFHRCVHTRDLLWLSLAKSDVPCCCFLIKFSATIVARNKPWCYISGLFLLSFYRNSFCLLQVCSEC